MYESGLYSDVIDRMSPLSDGKIQMAWLAVYGSHSVNGVAALHTDILKTETLKDWYEIYPEKFSNKTNGVTPRRWLRTCNPELGALITELLGSDHWVTHLDDLKELEKFADDEKVLKRFLEVKRAQKATLADYLEKKQGVKLNPDSVYDIQIKRLHEYKRQLLNALYALNLYDRIKENPKLDMPPVTIIFGAKAAPGYFRAKAIIKFINEIAKLIESDMMNGAVTLGTMDGANVEIAEAVGNDNIYIFGCRSQDMAATKAYYNPQWQYENIPGLKKALDRLVDGTFNDEGTGMFRDLYNGLIYGDNWQPGDPYYVLGDFDDYRKTRDRLYKDYKDELGWAKKSRTSSVGLRSAGSTSLTPADSPPTVRSRSMLTRFGRSSLLRSSNRFDLQCLSTAGVRYRAPVVLCVFAIKLQMGQIFLLFMPMRRLLFKNLVMLSLNCDQCLTPWSLS